MSKSAASLVAMFPLGTVLFPRQLLPLQVFEPRYRVMMADVIAGANGLTPYEFGVALIERGHEVGGGDVRSAFGCQAHIVQNELLVDGRLGMVAVGVRRIRVVEWLSDDPYPRAICIPIEEAQPTRSERRVPDAGVTDAQVPDAQVPDAIHPEWPDNDAGSDAAHALIADLHESIGRPFVLGDWPTDAGELADAMAARLGYGPFDAQRVLCEVSGGSRLAIAASVLAEALEDLRLGRSLEGDG